MGLAGSVLALLTPALAGALWVRVWLEGSDGTARWATSIGLGYVLGVFTAAVMLAALGHLGAALSIWPIIAAAAALSFFAYRRLSKTRVLAQAESAASMPVWQKLAFRVLLSFLLVRALFLGLEVLQQPMSSWDAWTTWALRAKVWTELERWVPFVAPEVWLADSVANAHTTPAWNYPEIVSFIAAFSAIASGSWSDQAANLPWLGLWFALGLGCYGQLRALRVAPLPSLCAVAVVSTLPILNSHVALAGLADLWLATTLGFAFASFLRWLDGNESRHLALALVLLAMGALIKREGLVWAAAFVPALIAVRSRRTLFVALLAVVAALTAVALTRGIDLPVLGRFEVSYQGNWSSLIKHLFVFGTWHLFSVVFAWTLWRSIILAANSPMVSLDRASLGWVMTSLGLLYFLFFWTDAAAWAEQGTAVNRVMLHFVPAWTIWMTRVWYSTKQ